MCLMLIDMLPVMIAGLIGVLLAGLCLLILWLFDLCTSRLVPLGAGVVLKKTHVPAHSEHYTMWIMVGKTMVPMPQTRWVPDSWDVEVECGGRVLSASASKATWDRLNRGSLCGVLAQKGFLMTHGYEVEHAR